MRYYVLTKTERTKIKTYLETGVKIDSYAVTLSRVKRHLPRLRDDMALIEQFLEKESEEERCQHIPQPGENTIILAPPIEGETT